jgi:hypothetical protein
LYYYGHLGYTYFGHLVHIVAIWYIISRFGTLCQDKSGNSASRSRNCVNAGIMRNCFSRETDFEPPFAPQNAVRFEHTSSEATVATQSSNGLTFWLAESIGKI